MASIIFSLIFFSSDAVAKYFRQRRHAAKAQSTAQRSPQLELENFARIQQWLSESCGYGGGNHFSDEEHHPGGPPYVGSPVIRNDVDGEGFRRYDDGSDTRPIEDLPPVYDEVVAETGRRG